MKRITGFIGIAVLGIAGLVSESFADVLYDAEKNTITVRGQNIEGLEAISTQLNKPDIFSYDKSTRRARSTASIKFSGGKARNETITIGDPGRKTTLTFICAPEADSGSTILFVEKVGSFNLINTTVQAEGSEIGQGRLRFAGIELMKISRAVRIEQSAIKNAHTAIRFWSCRNVLVENVTISRCDHGLYFGATGLHVVRNTDIDAATAGILFVNYNGSPTISDCRIKTGAEYSLFLAPGSAPKMTPNIPLTNVRYDRQKTMFDQGAGLLSVGWHFKVRVLDEQGIGVAKARLRFTPDCQSEVVHVLDLLEPGLASTDEKGELSIDLVEGVMMMKETEAERAGGDLYPYTYRVEIAEEKGFRVIEEAFALTNNAVVEYRKQGDDTYKKTVVGSVKSSMKK